jgi:hypothetical protein
LELWKKSYVALMVFYYFWAGRAVKTILAPKFGGPVQKWSRAGLGNGGVGGNPGSPFLPLTPPPFSPPFLLSPLPPPFSLALEGGQGTGATYHGSKGGPVA